MLILGNGCQICDLFVVEKQIAVVLVRLQERGANGMAFVVSCKNQNSSYRDKFDQGKRTFELAGNSSYPSKNPREMGLYLS